MQVYAHGEHIIFFSVHATKDLNFSINQSSGQMGRKKWTDVDVFIEKHGSWWDEPQFKSFKAEEIEMSLLNV